MPTPTLAMASLHPIAAAILLLTAGEAFSAGPPAGAHPGWTVVNLRPDATFKPMVTGLGFLSDGSLVVSHWGGTHANVHLRQMNGAVHIVRNVIGDAPNPAVSTFAEKLEDPLGLLVKDDRIYVTGGERLIELPDANKDGKAEAARTIATIAGTHARHEFLHGLVFKDGKFWMNPGSAKPTPAEGLPGWGQKNPNRGTTMSVDPATGAYEVFAMGLREPNGIGIGPDGEIFAPDVQGNWIAANKLNHIKKGRFYGFKHEPAEKWDAMPISPPVVWLPEGQVSSSPGNPLYVESGRYAGQMLIGDVVVGGIRRIFVEKVAGEYQGTVFHFSGGLEAGVNRLLWGPDGYLYVGMCGQGSGWSFKQDFGLQKMKPSGKEVFEMLAVRSRAGGMEIEYSEEINAAAENKAGYVVKTSHYVSTSTYESPPQGGKTLPVSSVQVSADRKKVFLDVPGLEAGKVVYITLAADIAAKSGNALWTTETWYTLNNISSSKPFETTGIRPGEEPAQKAWAREIRIGTGRGSLDIGIPFDGEHAYSVHDMRGTLVAGASGPARKDYRVSTRNWSSGVYLVRIAGQGRSMVRQVAIP